MAAKGKKAGIASFFCFTPNFDFWNDGDCERRRMLIVRASDGASWTLYRADFEPISTPVPPFSFLRRAILIWTL